MGCEGRRWLFPLWLFLSSITTFVNLRDWFLLLLLTWVAKPSQAGWGGLLPFFCFGVFLLFLLFFSCESLTLAQSLASAGFGTPSPGRTFPGTKGDVFRAFCCGFLLALVLMALEGSLTP